MTRRIRNAEKIHHAIDVAVEAAFCARCRYDDEVEAASQVVREAIELLRTKAGRALLEAPEFHPERVRRKALDRELPRSLLFAVAWCRDDYARDIATLGSFLMPEMGAVLRTVAIRARKDQVFNAPGFETLPSRYAPDPVDAPPFGPDLVSTP